MVFEWHEAKREANIKEHGVDFARAARIFENPVLERVDDRRDYGERRLIALGHSDGMFLVVVYTWRGESRRIISAWKAGSDDQAAYHARIGG